MSVLSPTEAVRRRERTSLIDTEAHDALERSRAYRSEDARGA